MSSANEYALTYGDADDATGSPLRFEFFADNRKLAIDHAQTLGRGRSYCPLAAVGHRLIAVTLARLRPAALVVGRPGAPGGGTALSRSCCEQLPPGRD